MIRQSTSAIRLIATLAACCAVASIVGCGTKSTRSTSGSASTVNTAGEQASYRKELLQSALGLLNAPERFDDDDQLEALIVERLNQWRRLGNENESLPASADKQALADKRDALVETLPDPLTRMRIVRRLTAESFDPAYDGQFLREATTLRDVVNHIESEKLDDRSLATALFDWTVRNIQLEPQPAGDATAEEQWMALHLPLETLLYGRGTPLERAWAFILLARQAGLDVVLLATPDPRDAQQMRPWAAALVSGDELYLFDYTYGLPIPGPGGKGIATLAEAAADDAVLRQMDIPGDRPYPRKAADLKNTIAVVEGSPGYLMPRMKALESQLTGRDRIVLSTSPSALAEKLRTMKSISDVKLWAMPYETLQQRGSLSSELQRAAQLERLPFNLPAEPEQASKKTESRRDERPVRALRLGRLLQLRGNFGNTDAQRPTNQQGQSLSEIVERGAKYYYLRAIPRKEQLDDIAQLQREGREVAPGRRFTKEFVDAYQRVRDDAAYWLGLIWFEQGALDTAVQYFGPMTLDAAPNGPWANGARYNLARSYEAQGKLPQAIKLYEADKSPQRYGNRLRAERLKVKTVEKSSDGKK